MLIADRAQLIYRLALSNASPKLSVAKIQWLPIFSEAPLSHSLMGYHELSLRLLPSVPPLTI